MQSEQRGRAIHHRILVGDDGRNPVAGQYHGHTLIVLRGNTSPRFAGIEKDDAHPAASQDVEELGGGNPALTTIFILKEHVTDALILVELAVPDEMHHIEFVSFSLFPQTPVQRLRRCPFDDLHLDETALGQRFK